MRTSRQADAHIRFCIVVCVFVLLVTLPMHFVDFDDYTGARFGPGKLGTDILSHQWSATTQQALFVYKNGVTLPPNNTYNCMATLIDHNQKPILLEQNNYKLQRGSGKKSNIFSFLIRLKHDKNKIPKRKDLYNCTLQMRIYDHNKNYLASVSGACKKGEEFLQNVKFSYPDSKK